MCSPLKWRLITLVALLGATLPPCAASADDAAKNAPQVATTQVMRTSNMIGMDVRNPAGEDLGRVEDLMFDMRSGRIDYAILSHGGFLGLGDKLFPIPWREMSFRFDETENYFVVDATRQFLKRLPSFDRANWPDQTAGWQELVEGLFPIHAGIVQSAGEGRLVMTFTDGGAVHSHAVASDAHITRDGQPVALADLKPGDHVKVTTEEQAGIRAVTKIEAESAAIFNGYPLEQPEER